MERETPWLRAEEKRNLQRQEERNGKMEGGSKQINSGRFLRPGQSATTPCTAFSLSLAPRTQGSYRIDKGRNSWTSSGTDYRHPLDYCRRFR